MDSSGSAPAVTRAEIRDVFSQSETPGTPFTTSEIAARLDCPTDAAALTLRELADRDEVGTRATDDGTRVWWQLPERAEDTEQRSQLQEFGAFVSAVKDYAIFMLEPDGTVASWNQGAERIKGYAEADIVGEHFSTFYTDEDAEEGVPETNLEVAATEGRVEDEGWRVRSDGSRFWANVVITAIRDVDGTLQGFTKVTRDMTEQREYELQLREERDLTQQILETVPVGICVLGSDGKFARANRQALELLDLEKGDFGAVSIDSRTLYDAEDAIVSTDERPWSRVVDTGRPVYDFECRADWLADGDDDRWLSINAVPLEGGLSEENEIVVSLEEITEQKERERQLERRKTELETELSEILGRISDAFFALDDEWRFTHLNEQAAELFHYPEDELVGRSFWEVFPERSDDQLWDEFHDAMATQEPVDFELYDERFGAWLEYNVYPSESGLSIYIHDITDRREYQRKLEESNERLEQFAHAASHDLQEPLRMVSSYLQLIDRRYGDELDDDGREFLAFAVDGADRMREMIESLLAYSRVETRGDPFEPVDLDAVLDDVCDDLQRRIAERDADIASESLPRVEGDRGQLRQLFQNVLDNALEYSGDEPARIRIATERRGDEWVVSVEDNGIGIDPDDQDRVFEVFQRLHTNDEYEGTGIGLALCERIVERHGGDIWIESEPGAGTTVSFTLPDDA